MTKQLLLVTACAFLLTAATAASGQTPNAAAIYKERCASCHDPGAGAEATRAPARDVLRSRTVQQIFASLEPGGVMAANSVGLSTAEKQAVATFLSGTAATTAADPAVGLCAAGAARPAAAARPASIGFGNDASNSRFQNAKAAGLAAADVPKLTLKWAFGFPGATVASGQPTVAAGRVFVGNVNGMVYSLDAKTGCTHWTFKAMAASAAITVARLASTARRAQWRCSATSARAYDRRAVGRADLENEVDEHAMAVTGAPSYRNGRLWCAVSSSRKSPVRAPAMSACVPRQRWR